MQLPGIMGDDYFNCVLDLADQAGRRGEYEVAYHLLMAALHVADRRRDLHSVDQVGQRAAGQGEEVEAVRPPHQLSRVRAAERGQTALYDSLRLHVDAVRTRLHGVEMAR